MGLDVTLFNGPDGYDSDNREDWGKNKIEIDSVKYPQHLFKIGYWRSSYNDGGINSVLDRARLPNLYDIVQPGDEYEVCPDWSVCLENAKDAIEQLDNYLKQPISKYDVMTVSFNMFSEPQINSDEQALQAFAEELARKEEAPPFGNSYGNHIGDFFLDTIPVVAVIPGYTRILGKQPCSYVVFKTDNQWEFYHQALEIAQETIEYVLAQPDPTIFYLHWSS